MPENSLFDPNNTTTKYEFIKFSAINCPNCFIDFMVTEAFNARHRESGATFYCPSGHPQSYQPSEIGKLTKQLEEVRRSQEYYLQKFQAANNEVIHKKGQITKLKKRIANGVCPCCNRQFGNLHRHMQTQHPNFVANDEPCKPTAERSPMTTAQAIAALNKPEFTVAEVFGVLNANHVKRKMSSLQTSLFLMKADGRLEELSGKGRDKCYKEIKK